jgi:hypothetical protein
MYAAYGTGSSLSTPSFSNLMPFEKHFYIEHPRIKVRATQNQQLQAGRQRRCMLSARC